MMTEQLLTPLMRVLRHIEYNLLMYSDVHLILKEKFNIQAVKLI